jgi:hypothetical protein
VHLGAALEERKVVLQHGLLLLLGVDARLRIPPAALVRILRKQWLRTLCTSVQLAALPLRHEPAAAS